MRKVALDPFSVALVVAGLVSDRLRLRKPFMLLGGLGSIGCTLWFTLRATEPHTGYYTFAVIVAGIGVTSGIAYSPWMAAVTCACTRRPWRVPASVCGLVGIKPSRGRVSSGPSGADVTGLAVQGPLARSVRDAAALLDVPAGPEPGDPYWAPPLPDGETFLGHAGRSPGRLRVGRYATPAAEGVAVDPACLAAWEHASRLLESLGHTVEDIPTPFGPEISEHFVTAWGVQSLGRPLDAGREALLRPVTRAWRDYGRAVSGERFASAVTGMHAAARRAIRATQRYDVVLTPTLATLPQSVEHFDESGDPLVNLHRQGAFSAFTSPCNMTGQPAVSLPLYWAGGGRIPVGVQLVGRPADEATLIALSAQVEEACPWRDRYAPLLS